MSAAVIFDLDGLLIDSEPIWREVEIRVFGDLGVALTDDLCRTTMGLGVDEVVAHWFARAPWSGPDLPAVATTIVSEVVATIRARGTMMPGVEHALALVESLRLRRAVASSSREILIAAALERMDLVGAFDVVISAEHEPFGKPHPGVYLTAARRLGVSPEECVALEDSPNGVAAAKAAGMRCIAVPERGSVAEGAQNAHVVAGADVVLQSLADLVEAHLDA
ncbi:MAG: hexitol phosphatase HxpB [Acidimicrobiia bacterium]|nr:hexitol phosphatase HxpB [Acidimicrobiia bacterium]